MAALGSCSDLLLIFPRRSFVLNPSPKIKGMRRMLSLSIPRSCSRRSSDRPPADGPKKRISEQSSWDSKDADGKDYLYRLGQEADNMNIAVGARKGIVDDLFVGEFLGKDCMESLLLFLEICLLCCKFFLVFCSDRYGLVFLSLFSFNWVIIGFAADIVFDYRQKVTRSFEYLEGDYYIAPFFLVSSCSFFSINFFFLWLVCYSLVFYWLWLSWNRTKFDI